MYVVRVKKMAFHYVFNDCSGVELHVNYQKYTFKVLGVTLLLVIDQDRSQGGKTILGGGANCPPCTPLKKLSLGTGWPVKVSKSGQSVRVLAFLLCHFSNLVGHSQKGFLGNNNSAKCFNQRNNVIILYSPSMHSSKIFLMATVTMITHQLWI
jgi:hypothetical protein